MERKQSGPKRTSGHKGRLGARHPLHGARPVVTAPAWPASRYPGWGGGRTVSLFILRQNWSFGYKSLAMMDANHRREYYRLRADEIAKANAGKRILQAVEELLSKERPDGATVQ